MESLEGKERQPIRALLKANGLEQKGLNSAIAFLLHKSGITEKPIGFGGFDRFIDAWGEPLMFVWPDANDAVRLNPKLRSQRKPVLIWSKGPNKIDDKGEGDDVFYTQPE